MAKDIATARRGAKVLGVGSVDVRNIQSLQAAVDKCIGELGGIDFVMWVYFQLWSLLFHNMFGR